MARPVLLKMSAEFPFTFLFRPLYQKERTKKAFVAQRGLVSLFENRWKSSFTGNRCFLLRSYLGNGGQEEFPETGITQRVL
ncbi:MAG: hypothetical protein JWM99_4350 [Verrucomicrobiales bacterium]|nr:hypothetical protein [Verrucomicrobiales bacterium]